jgi:DNA-binding MarR family transcriptional regulator
VSQRTRPDAVSTIVDQWRQERPELDPSPIEVFGRIHRISLRYQAVAAAGFESHGITSESFDVLAALRRSGPPFQMSSSELATGFLLSAAGVSFRLDRLEREGLIERFRDDQDRRVVYARLTDAGRAKADRVIETHLENTRKLLTGLPSDDRDHLGRLLSQLESSMAKDSDIL